jgi:hypothetical protein
MCCSMLLVWVISWWEPYGVARGEAQLCAVSDTTHAAPERLRTSLPLPCMRSAVDVQGKRVTIR